MWSGMEALNFKLGQSHPVNQENYMIIKQTKKIMKINATLEEGTILDSELTDHINTEEGDWQIDLGETKRSIDTLQNTLPSFDVKSIKVYQSDVIFLGSRIKRIRIFFSCYERDLGFVLMLRPEKRGADLHSIKIQLELIEIGSRNDIEKLFSKSLESVRSVS